ncbi:unnamed protein product [Caenorhabditis auriculariae]|uniref:Uncharacterized protein n=1 Tax=Caenorhabditis auriculariae TaxID=2777116 RepID=A0A8S1HDW7_9PELO|nr:unnamed protein product [Caenorhabditis auriculariae]
MNLSLYTTSYNSETASLASRHHSHYAARHWSSIFDERIYEICNIVHPGLPIELDAVEHIRKFLEQIVKEIAEQRATSVVEVDKYARKLFSNGLQSVMKDAWDNMHAQQQRAKFQKPPKQVLVNQHKLAGFIREVLGYREKEKKDKEKREVERIASYIYYACESLTEDILRLTGNYVKNIRNSEQKITLQNLDVALCADRALMELRIKLKNEEEAESPGGFGFLAEFDDYVAEQVDETAQAVGHGPNVTPDTYESVGVEFLRDERRFIRELNRINVFRRRLESVLIDEDKCLLQCLFGNLNDIYELALKIERTLEDAIEMNDTPCIGMGIWDLAETYEFDAYTSYIVRDDEKGELAAMTTCISHTIESLLRSPRCESLFKGGDMCFNSSFDGPSFRLAVQYVLPQLLHTPILHFFQYVEYINKLLRLTKNDEDRVELNNCKNALMSVRTAIDVQCNELPELKSIITSHIEQLTRGEKIYNVQRFHEIQSTIDGFSGSPIGKTCSEIIKEGDLQMIRPSLTYSTDITKKQKWKTDRFLFLFDQLLLICKRHRNMVKFKERLPVHLLDVFDAAESEGIQHSFKLASRDNTCLPRTYHFICKSAEEKRAWMGVLVMVTTKSVLDRILDNYEKEEAKRIPLLIPSPEQYRFAEPDSEENISFEDYTSSSGIPVIKNGTVLKLVERLTYHSYTDSKYIQTFLISYRSFCTPSDFFELLIERFNVPIPSKLPLSHDKRGGPLAGRYDTVQSHGLSASSYSPLYEQSFQRFRKEYERPVQLRVLSVINQWVKFHWHDFDCDPVLLEKLDNFLQKCIDPREKLTKQHKKFCKTILTTMDKRLKSPPATDSTEKQEGHVNTAFVYGEDGQPPAYANDGATSRTFSPKKPETVWHTATKGDVDVYDLLTLHPLEIGRQLTLLHFDLYRAIKPIELVGAAWTQHDKNRRSPQLLKLTNHSTLLTYWVSRSIVETESLEERVAMFNRVLEVMSVFEELHNFTGLVAFISALNSACIHRLSWCWDKLDNEKQKSYNRFVTLCGPRWTEMQKRLQTINPPCIPFFGHYLNNIFFFELGNSTFVKSPGPKSKEPINMDDPNSKRVLVSFLKCRRISDIIREIQMYQNEPYPLQLEPTIRLRNFRTPPLATQHKAVALLMLKICLTASQQRLFHFRYGTVCRYSPGETFTQLQIY